MDVRCCSLKCDFRFAFRLCLNIQCHPTIRQQIIETFRWKLKASRGMRTENIEWQRKRKWKWVSEVNSEDKTRWKVVTRKGGGGGAEGRGGTTSKREHVCGKFKARQKCSIEYSGFLAWPILRLQTAYYVLLYHQMIMGMGTMKWHNRMSILNTRKNTFTYVENRFELS